MAGIGAVSSGAAGSHPAAGALGAHTARVLRQAAARSARAPRLLDRVRDAIRTRHHGRRTEPAHVAWTRRWHQAQAGAGWVELSGALAAKYPNAGRAGPWQWGIGKPVGCHTFRHSSAIHLLEDGHGIRTVQEFLGHQDVRTTRLHTHVLDRGPGAVRSPADRRVGP